MWGNGSFKPMNLEVGALVVGEANQIRRSYFATGIRESARLLSGSKDKSLWMGDEGQVLTSCDLSSLVIDKLCDQARGRRAAVSCFYFDFAAQKEQSPTNMMGALLKQVLSGLEEIPEEIAQTYEDHQKVIDGRGLKLIDIVKMLQTTASEKPTFICIDALDECVAGYRVKVLDSLNQILQRSPGTRVFVTGRPQIQAEVEKRLSTRVIVLRITPRRHDIIGYLQTRLDEDTKLNAMDDSLKADILKKIPEDVSEM